MRTPRTVATVFALLTFCLLVPRQSEAITYYVDKDSTGHGTGASWDRCL